MNNSGSRLKHGWKPAHRHDLAPNLEIQRQVRARSLLQHRHSSWDGLCLHQHQPSHFRGPLPLCWALLSIRGSVISHHITQMLFELDLTVIHRLEYHHEWQKARQWPLPESCFSCSRLSIAVKPGNEMRPPLRYCMSGIKRSKPAVYAGNLQSPVSLSRFVVVREVGEPARTFGLSSLLS